MIDSAQTTEHNEPINLTSSQELAASWSLFWPSWVASFVLAGLMVATMAPTPPTPTVVYLVGKAILLAAQSVFASRLVRKNYRSFFIGVLKEGEPLKRSLTLSEQTSVSVQLLWPYVVFFIGASLLASWIAKSVPREQMKNFDSIAQFFLILILGPTAIRWALHAQYQGFRLQAYRPKRKQELGLS